MDKFHFPSIVLTNSKVDVSLSLWTKTDIKGTRLAEQPTSNLCETFKLLNQLDT